MPKRTRYLHAIKPVDITEYDYRSAHPLVEKLHNLAVKYRKIEQQLDDERKRHKPPKPKYHMSVHFVASNEFFILLKIANEEQIRNYIKYWLKGPKPDEVIRSVPYYTVINSFGEDVAIVDGAKGIGVLRAPMHVLRDDYDRFLATKQPMSEWILDNVLNRCVSGIDYSDREIQDESSTMSMEHAESSTDTV